LLSARIVLRLNSIILVLRLPAGCHLMPHVGVVLAQVDDAHPRCHNYDLGARQHGAPILCL